MKKPVDDMAIPAPWTCGDCVHFRRCAGMIGVQCDERTCDWAPSRFRLDTIGALCRIMREGNVTMTLYGEPINEDQLRNVVTTLAVARLANANSKSVGEGTPQP